MLNKKTIVFSSFILLLLLFLSSCHPAKHVPEEEYLLRKVDLDYDNKDIDNRDLLRTVRQKPNKKILSFFRFHLWVYNMAHSGKERDWKNRIGEVVGEAPVIYNEFATEQTKNNVKSYLESQGYYSSEVTYEVEFGKRVAKVTYDIKTNNPHIIDEINYNISDIEILNIIDKDLDNSLLKVGDNFSTEIMQNERERLVRLFKKSGYYYFSINNIHYYIDTTQTPLRAKLTLAIRKSFTDEKADFYDYFLRQKIKDVYIYTNYEPSTALDNLKAYQSTFDTVLIDGIHLIYSGDLLIKPDVILQACFILPDEYYDIINIERTQSHYTNLRQFRLINIRMEKPSNTELYNSEKYLDCHIYLTPLVKQSYSLELEGMNTSGNMGASSSVTYNNRNLLRGAENFSVTGALSLQSMLSPTDETKRFLNTFESFGETRLTIPRLVLPFFESYEFSKKHNPSTRFSTSYSYQKRPDYTRSVGIVSFGYIWKGEKNSYLTHFFNPLKFNLVKIYDFNPAFEAEIKNLYIQYAYKDQLFTVISYDMIFNNQKPHRRDNFTYFWLNLETSGNLMNGIYNWTGQTPVEDSYRLMGIEFAQFVKGDIDFRYYIFFSEKRSLVYRGFFGIGFPYGNSTKGLPFIKKYFTGGANDLRAWQVRTLGPGSYTGGAGFNQIADMKLVLNLEYRFPIISFLEGAIFLDAGNIWAVDKKDDREGALFEWDRFYNEIAVGTGVGTRLDFSFFIIRFDFGIPLYDPKYPDDNRWLRSFKDLKIRDFTLNFGIGYPF